MVKRSSLVQEQIAMILLRLINQNGNLAMYKWDWNGTGTTDTKVRVIYFDNIRLGNEKATYANMVSK